MKNKQPTKSVELTVYEWHLLLNDMEDHLRIVNRNRNTTKGLYERIASQLCCQKVNYILNEPNPLPDKKLNKTWDFFTKKWFKQRVKLEEDTGIGAGTIKEENVKKGGTNDPPTTLPPPPPKGQKYPDYDTRNIPETEACPSCGHPWSEHDFGVPSPYCPVYLNKTLSKKK